MKHIGYILICLLLSTMVYSCKTSEKNYREAYEKTMAARQARESGDIDSTIYGRVRRDFGSHQLVVAGDTVEVKVQHVKVTADGGGIPESLMRYSVVVGQFKQLFNARSLRERLFEAGYPAAFVVETAEPYYYVIAGSYNLAEDAVKELRRIEADAPVAMKKPLPFILQRAGR